MEDQQQQQETTKDKIKNFVIGFGVLCMIGWMMQYCGGNKNTSTSSSPSSNSGGYSSSHTCPHCYGKGQRYNNVTLKYGNCGSCGGDGIVTDQQYERLSK